MKQVYTDQECSLNSTILLDEKQAHHIYDVLRTKERETVRVVNENAEVYLAHPSSKPYLYIFGKEEVQPRLVDVTLCAALIKSDKFEWMLQKAAELGVSRIVPFVCRNTIIQIDPKKLSRKMERWRSILDNACRQCNRPDKVELMPLECLENLDAYKSKCNLVAYEKSSGSEHHLAYYLSSSPSSVTCCIGPEGGFESSEIDRLNDQGFASCSLGNYILRAETAACYVLSCIEYQSHVRNWGEENEFSD